MAYQEIDTENNQAILNSIDEGVNAIAGAKGITSDLRVTLIGGTTAVTGTLTGVTTVTNVTNAGTLAGITAIGGYQAPQVVPAAQNTAAVLSNVNNVIIS